MLSQGMTVFLVEQNAFHALKLAHRAYVMVNGRITMSGTGRELLAKPEIRAAYLGGRQALNRNDFMWLFVQDNFGIFLVLTVVIGGGAAFLAGRALAIKMAAAVDGGCLHDSARLRAAVFPLCPVPWPSCSASIISSPTRRS